MVRLSATIESELARLKGNTSPDDEDPRWGVQANAALVQVLEMVEDDFVSGEAVERKSDGSFTRVFPSLAQLAEKYSVDIDILRRAHEAFLLGLHREEFPGLAAPSPPEATLVVGPEHADLNFRDPGPEQAQVLGQIVGALGL